MQPKQPHIPDWLIPSGFAFYLAVNLISWKMPFFWDALLTSTLVTHFYENGWSGGIAPAGLDAGHPPLFYAWLLGWWKLAGRSLTVSHLAMLPLLWTMYYQFVQVAARLTGSRQAVVWAAVLFCFETTILAQSFQVSYDIALLALYLTGLRYVLDRRPLPVALATAALCLINLRGVFAAFALLVTEAALRPGSDRPRTLVVKYLPGFALFGLWAGWHYLQTGWAVFTPAEAWSGHRGLASAQTWVRNAAAIVRVLLEPGRLPLALIVLWGLTEWIWRRKGRLHRVLSAVVIPLAVFSLAFVPFTNPIGHRYFMVVFALLLLLFVCLTENWPYRNYVRVAVAAGLLSGHSWIWSPPVSNGWDSHLGHLPYFPAARAMDSYLAESGIPADSLAAHFPLDVSAQQRYLRGSDARPGEIEDLGWNGYVLWSTVNNDFSAKDLERLERDCRLVHREKRLWVKVDLYDCSAVNRASSPTGKR